MSKFEWKQLWAALCAPWKWKAHMLQHIALVCILEDMIGKTNLKSNVQAITWPWLKTSFKQICLDKGLIFLVPFALCLQQFGNKTCFLWHGIVCPGWYSCWRWMQTPLFVIGSVEVTCLPHISYLVVHHFDLLQESFQTVLSFCRHFTFRNKESVWRKPGRNVCYVCFCRHPSEPYVGTVVHLSLQMHLYDCTCNQSKVQFHVSKQSAHCRCLCTRLGRMKWAHLPTRPWQRILPTSQAHI